MLDLAITGGACVLPTGTQIADIGVKDGRIVLVGGPGTLPEAVRSVSAGNHLVIPGGIDPHIHCGLEWKVSGQPAIYTDPAAQVSQVTGDRRRVILNGHRRTLRALVIKTLRAFVIRRPSAH